MRRRSANSPGLCPQFCCKTKGVICQWEVPVRNGAHECVETCNADYLIRPQEFALDLVIHDCPHENAGPCTETVLEPVRYRDDFMAALWLGNETERPPSQAKERRSRVDERFT